MHKLRYDKDKALLERVFRMPHQAADPEILKMLLKQEIIRLGIQDNPSRTVYQEQYHRGEAPSPNSVTRATQLSWSDLVHELGFNYDAKKNIAQNGKKGALKHLGTKQLVHLTDEATLERVVAQALELIHDERLFNVKDFKTRCKPVLGVSYDSLMRHGYSFEVLKKLYAKQYGENIRKASRWSSYSNAALMFLVIDYMKKHELTSLHQYVSYLNQHNDGMPAAETLKNRLQMTYSELNKLVKILLQ